MLPWHNICHSKENLKVFYSTLKVPLGNQMLDLDLRRYILFLRANN